MNDRKGSLKNGSKLRELKERVKQEEKVRKRNNVADKSTRFFSITGNLGY